MLATDLLQWGTKVRKLSPRPKTMYRQKTNMQLQAAIITHLNQSWTRWDNEYTTSPQFTDLV
jgi:hypothetical protein